MKQLTPTLESQAFATFLDDIRKGFLIEHGVSSEVFDGAVNLMGQLPSIALRTLDALHLAAAQQLGVDVVATADTTVHQACAALGLATSFFDVTPKLV